MPVFTYDAKTADGKRLRGTVRAPDRKQAQSELQRKNITVVTVKELKPKKDIFGKPIQAKASLKDITMMTRQLSTMIGAGLTLIESLETLYEQAKEPAIKLALDDIIERVRAGSDLSSALANHPKVFSRIYVNMVKAAEVSGQLDVILGRLAEYLEEMESLKREVKGAIMYPIFSLSLILLITCGLVVFVIPQFKGMFKQMGLEKLPVLTEIMLAIGDFAQEYFFYLAGGLVAAILAIRFYTRTKGGQRIWHIFLFNLPIFGELMRKVAISRFTRTLGTLLESGVNMLQSLEIVAGVAGNRIIEEATLYARDQISRGKQLSGPMGEHKVFPPLLIRMVGVGEKTGQLEGLLRKVSEFYDHEVRTTVKALTSVLEPILISIMGLVVGTIVVAIFLPILELQAKAMK